MSVITGQQGRIVLFDGPGEPFRSQTQVVRNLLPGEILVRNRYTTICGSDLHTFCGQRAEPCPAVLGHEIVGEILAIDASHSGRDLLGEALRPGDRITWTIFASDPGLPIHCAACRKKVKVCTSMDTSAPAEKKYSMAGSRSCILRPNTGIIRLPAEMPDAVAATINCSVATVAGALRMAGDLQNKKVLITGMGHLGITCAAMCREAGASWIGATDISEQRLDEARRFGVDAVLDMRKSEEDGTELIRQWSDGTGIDVVFDMSGSPAAMEFGISGLNIGGYAVWIGAVFNTRPVAISPKNYPQPHYHPRIAQL